jgi:hypothetical protein
LIPPPSTGEHPGKQIFDTLAKTLLPVVTLVLGYYFGSAQVNHGALAPQAASAASTPATAPPATVAPPKNP